MGKTIIEKIWDRHVVVAKDTHPDVFAIDLMLIHEVTSAQAFAMLRERGLAIKNLDRLVATLDHSIPTRVNRLEIYDDAARKQVETLRRNAEEFGVTLFDFDSGHQGIVHVIGPELGLTQPGMTIVCGDSHTSTHGAFGALAFGVGTSEVGHVLATGCLLLRRPKNMRVTFGGQLRKGVFAKDVVLALMSRVGVAGANGHVIEYTGDAIRSMSMEERMTICNMSIECGGRAGLVAPDETTYRWLANKPAAPDELRMSEAIAYWETFKSDDDAHWDKEVKIDISGLEPMVTWGTNPGQGVEITKPIPLLDDLPDGERQGAKSALEYVGLRSGQKLSGIPLQWAFVGSCTNGRIEDLREVARVLKGHKVNSRVKMYIVPGSEAVRKQAEQEGLAEIFIDAGAEFRMPGCSMCLGMNDDKVPSGERCISSSNRNFVGRQGTGSITHLASPATVAASAVTGEITSARDFIS